MVWFLKILASKRIGGFSLALLLPAALAIGLGYAKLQMTSSALQKAREDILIHERNMILQKRTDKLNDLAITQLVQRIQDQNNYEATYRQLSNEANQTLEKSLQNHERNLRNAISNRPDCDLNNDAVISLRHARQSAIDRISSASPASNRSIRKNFSSATRSLASSTENLSADPGGCMSQHDLIEHVIALYQALSDAHVRTIEWEIWAETVALPNEPITLAK